MAPDRARATAKPAAPAMDRPLTQDDVERQWRVYSARAAMPGRGETPHIAPLEVPEVKEEKLAATTAGGEE